VENDVEDVVQEEDCEVKEGYFDEEETLEKENVMENDAEEKEEVVQEGVDFVKEGYFEKKNDFV
jgi:hypothetical protein